MDSKITGTADLFDSCINIVVLQAGNSKSYFMYLQD